MEAVVKTLNVDGEEIRITLEKIENGKYSLVEDDYVGEIQAYMIARILFEIFIAEKSIKEIMLPFIPGLPTIESKPTFEECCVELLKAITI